MACLKFDGVPTYVSPARAELKMAKTVSQIRSERIGEALPEFRWIIAVSPDGRYFPALVATGGNVVYALAFAQKGVAVLG